MLEIIGLIAVVWVIWEVLAMWMNNAVRRAVQRDRLRR